MNYEHRKEIYKQIEELRKRPVVSYITSLRPNATGQMAPDVIPEFARIVSKIEEKHRAIDLLIISNGGDPTVAWRIISMLRERFDEVGVLLPFTAFSAATLLALGANEIVMHPFANLGPVDPQLTADVPGNEGRRQHFGAEDLHHFLSFVREDVGITDQRELQNAFAMLCKDVGSIPIGAAKRSTQLSLSLGEKLLALHMDDRNQARAIIESLSKSFFHHGYPVGRNEAKGMGMAITERVAELEKLLWEVWLSIEKEMKCNDSFDALQVVFEDQSAASLLSSATQVQIPTNLPPQVMQQVYNSVLQQIQLQPVNSVDYELFYATLESLSASSQFRTKLKINAVRRPDMNIAVSVNNVLSMWMFAEE